MGFNPVTGKITPADVTVPRFLGPSLIAEMEHGDVMYFNRTMYGPDISQWNNPEMTIAVDGLAKTYSSIDIKTLFEREEELNLARIIYIHKTRKGKHFNGYFIDDSVVYRGEKTDGDLKMQFIDWEEPGSIPLRVLGWITDPLSVQAMELQLAKKFKVDIGPNVLLDYVHDLS